MKKALYILIAAGFLAGLAASASAQTAAPEQGKEELKLQLPKPMFVGTPRNINSPNLEKVTGKSRGPFFVPTGTTLLSLNKPVTSSDTQPVIGERGLPHGRREVGRRRLLRRARPRQAVGRRSTSERPHLLNAVLVWHYHAQARVYRDVVVQVSDDKDFVTGVTTVFNNDHDNSSGLGIGKDKEYIETDRGQADRPARRQAAATSGCARQRQHLERHEPLRRSGGFRHAGQMSKRGVRRALRRRFRWSALACGLARPGPPADAP